MIEDDRLREVTPNANTKECYYIVDAVGVTEHEKVIPHPVVSPGPGNRVAKQKRYDELEEFFEGRMIQNKDWFRNNNIITSSYSFVKKVLDSIAGR